MGDLDEIVDSRPTPNHGHARGRAVDAGVRADLDVILQDDPPQLGDLLVAAVAGGKTESVVSDDRARVNDHPGSQFGLFSQDDVRIDQTLRSDLHLGTDNRPGENRHAVPDHRSGGDHDIRTDRNILAQLHARIDQRRGMDPRWDEAMLGVE